MTIPHRFSLEYASRCLTLMNEFEKPAENKCILVSFSMMLATPLLAIPWERHNGPHFLETQDEDKIREEMKKILKEKFLISSFWNESKKYLNESEKTFWKKSKICNNIDKPDDWVDSKDKHPLREAENEIKQAKADRVIRIMRNALSHGNIIYFNENIVELPNTPIAYICFVSKPDLPKRTGGWG